jgi:hypothetical protein
VEIASAPEVTSAATLGRLYRQHGMRGSGEGLCTAEAQRVTTIVLAEVGATQGAQRQPPAAKTGRPTLAAASSTSTSVFSQRGRRPFPRS